MLDALPRAKVLLGDKGYDADWFRDALAERGITPCIPLKGQPQDPDRLRQGALPPAPQDREHVRQASRTGDASTPATTDAPTPSCPPSHRRNRHLLALINES